MESRDYYLWLSCISSIELSEKHKLIKFFENPEGVWSASEKSFEKFGINPRTISVVKDSKKKFDVEKVENKMFKEKVRYVSKTDTNYPEKLIEIEDAPFGLFYKGKLPKQHVPTVAVIGSRICSEYGKSITYKLVKELAERGVQIISGLAMGIDGYAHRAALSVNGKTFGILGTGLDKIYPKENIDIYNEMYNKGGVISEYYFDTFPLRTHFPERNRIIAGLSDCILVVEAKNKSGTMITTDKALEQGKEVFVVPGRIGDVMSEGCLKLARQGANLILSSDDIAFSLKDKYPEWINYNKNDDGQYTFITNNKSDKFVNFLSSEKFRLEKDERIVYALLSFKPKHFEQLVIESGLDYFIVIGVISELCKKGLAIESSPEYYIKSN